MGKTVSSSTIISACLRIKTTRCLQNSSENPSDSCIKSWSCTKGHSSWKIVCQRTVNAQAQALVQRKILNIAIRSQHLPLLFFYWHHQAAVIYIKFDNVVALCLQDVNQSDKRTNLWLAGSWRASSNNNLSASIMLAYPPRYLNTIFQLAIKKEIWSCSRFIKHNPAPNVYI